MKSSRNYDFHHLKESHENTSREWGVRPFTLCSSYQQESRQEDEWRRTTPEFLYRRAKGLPSLVSNVTEGTMGERRLSGAKPTTNGISEKTWRRGVPGGSLVERSDVSGVKTTSTGHLKVTQNKRLVRLASVRSHWMTILLSGLSPTPLHRLRDTVSSVGSGTCLRFWFGPSGSHLGHSVVRSLYRFQVLMFRVTCLGTRFDVRSWVTEVVLVSLLFRPHPHPPLDPFRFNVVGVPVLWSVPGFRSPYYWNRVVSLKTSGSTSVECRWKCFRDPEVGDGSREDREVFERVPGVVNGVEDSTRTTPTVTIDFLFPFVHRES